MAKKKRKIQWEYFPREDIKKYQKLLYVYLDTKRILAVEYIKGKKRIVLHKEREVRLAKPGGFSQAKFRRHVKFMKTRTIPWHTEHLSKKEVFRPPYDLIKVDCRDISQRTNAVSILSKLGDNLIIV